MTRSDTVIQFRAYIILRVFLVRLKIEFLSGITVLLLGYTVSLTYVWWSSIAKKIDHCVLFSDYFGC